MRATDLRERLPKQERGIPMRVLIPALFGGMFLGLGIFTSHGCREDMFSPSNGSLGVSQESDWLLWEDKRTGPEESVGFSLAEDPGAARPSGEAALPSIASSGDTQTAGESFSPAETFSEGTSDRVSERNLAPMKAKSRAPFLPCGKEKPRVHFFLGQGAFPGTRAQQADPAKMESPEKQQPVCESRGPTHEAKGAAEQSAGKKSCEAPGGKSGFMYELPLEYHFEVPEVPERIRGPTPMPVVSKPQQPAQEQLPHRE